MSELPEIEKSHYRRQREAREKRRAVYLAAADALQRACILPMEVFAAVFFFDYDTIRKSEAFKKYRIEIDGKVFIDVSKWRDSNGIEIQQHLNLAIDPEERKMQTDAESLIQDHLTQG